MSFDVVPSHAILALAADHNSHFGRDYEDFVFHCPCFHFALYEPRGFPFPRRHGRLTNSTLSSQNGAKVDDNYCRIGCCFFSIARTNDQHYGILPKKKKKKKKVNSYFHLSLFISYAFSRSYAIPLFLGFPSSLFPSLQPSIFLPPQHASLSIVTIKISTRLHFDSCHLTYIDRRLTHYVGRWGNLGQSVFATSPSPAP